MLLSDFGQRCDFENIQRCNNIDYLPELRERLESRRRKWEQQFDMRPHSTGRTSGNTIPISEKSVISNVD